MRALVGRGLSCVRLTRHARVRSNPSINLCLRVVIAVVFVNATAEHAVDEGLVR